MACNPLGSPAWWQNIPNMTAEYLSGVVVELQARGDHQQAARVAAIALRKRELEAAHNLGMSLQEYQDMQAAENKAVLARRAIERRESAPIRVDNWPVSVPAEVKK